MEFLKFLVFMSLITAMAFEDLDLSNRGDDFIVEYTPSKEQQFASSINGFSLKLLNYVPQMENVFIATYSVANILSLFYFGSGGLTEEELKNSLEYTWKSQDKSSLHELFSLTNDLLISTRPRYYEFNCSNTLLINGRVGLIEEFKEEARDGFGVPFTVIDFETEGKEAALAINYWISTRTNGFLNGIINEIDPKWDMMALDVTYFRGIWKNKFSTFNTVHDKFYNLGLPQNAVTVPMMRMTARVEYYSDDKIKMIELPFKGEVYSMFVLLPRDQRGFETLEGGFEHALERAVFTTKERRVTVTLPKFKFNYSFNLSQGICDLGVSTVCTPELFNISEMVSQEKVVMGDMLFKTFIEVSEEGMNLGDYDIEDKPREISEQIFWKFEANYPFLFSIIDTRSGMILFLGSVKSLECEGCDTN